jgi:hypothetical protein
MQMGMQDHICQTSGDSTMTRLRKPYSLFLVLFSALACAPRSEDSCEDLSLSSIKIVSGTRCGDEDLSPVVLLELRQDGVRRGYCSGSIIGRRAVLSAAHCVEDMDEIRIKVGGVWRSSRNFVKHPDARVDGGKIEDPTHDLSVIQLPSDHTVQPLKIASSALLAEGDEFSIYGFGQSGELLESGNELRSGRMEAEQIRDGYFESTYSDDSSSICFGDSGGPAILAPSGGKVADPLIVGVASAISPALSFPPLLLRRYDEKSILSPFPLPFPIGGSSCSLGSESFHASVYNQSAIKFIKQYALDASFTN